MKREQVRDRAFRALLRLYPRPHREEFGREMLTVLAEARQGRRRCGILADAAWWVKEAAGLLAGALRERLEAGGPEQASPGRRYLRGAAAFGIGWFLLIFARVLTSPFEMFLRTQPWLRQVREGVLFVLMGFLAASLLGPALCVGRGRRAWIVVGCALGGVVGNLVILSLFGLLGSDRGLSHLWVQWTGTLVTGCILGGGFGAAHGDSRAMPRFLAAGVLSLTGTRLPCDGVVMALGLLGRIGRPATLTRAPGWTVVLVYATAYGFLSGGLFGLTAGARRPSRVQDAA